MSHRQSNRHQTRDVSSGDGRVDPPLAAANYTDYYHRRWEEDNENNNTRTPLVRFSEQLEVYTKQSSQRDLGTPTVPILRTSQNRGGLLGCVGGPIPSRSVPTSTKPPSGAPSAGGSAPLEKVSRRDPTPRSSERQRAEAQQREPAGNIPNGSSNSHLTSSDPPIDRSRRPVFSPAATLTRPRGSQSEPRHPVQRGAFLLSPSTNNIPNSMRSHQRRPQQQHDVELNPRRLTNEFSAQQPLHRQGGLRREQAPTPNNNRPAMSDDSLSRNHKLMAARSGTLRTEQAPTPNNNKNHQHKSAIIPNNSMERGPKVSAGSDWSELLPLNSTSGQDQLSTPTHWNVARLFSPGRARLTHEDEKNGAGAMKLDGSSVSSTETPMSLSDNNEVRLHGLDSDSESSSDDSTESQSAYLINKYTQPARKQPNGRSGKNRSAAEIYRTPPSPASTLDGLLGTVQSTPKASRPQRMQRRPFSDSKVMMTTHAGLASVPKTATKSSYLHLEEGGDGAFPHGNVGTEAALVSNLPRHIEVQIKEELFHASQDDESTTDSDVVLIAPSQKENFNVKSPRNRRIGSALGGVLKRIPRPAGASPKPVPYQDLHGDDISTLDSLVDGHAGNANQNGDLIIKKSTSDTDDTNKGSPRGYNGSKGSISKWDRFDEEGGNKDSTSLDGARYESDGDRLLVAGRKTKRRRKNKSWTVWLLVCTVIICLATGLPVYFMLTKDKSEESFNLTTVAPSLPNQEIGGCVHHDNASDGSFSERYSIIRNYLLLFSVGNTPMIDVPDTPQRKALCWISEFDKFDVVLETGNEQAIIQRYSLAVLYYSSQTNAESGSSSSLASSNFLSPTHECQWDAIMCSKPDSVTALLLSDKHLTGTLPIEVGNLVHLSFLELSLNEMTGTIPTSLQQLTSLEYFAMAFNELTGALPTVLGRMSSLQFLNMRSSGINGNIPTQLGSVTTLETLLLEGNWLSGTIPTQLGNLHNAHQMSFRKNYLSGRVAVELCELRENGELSDLTVDYWIDCDCCTG